MWKWFLLLCTNAHFNGPADVSGPEVKLRVEIFLWSDGSGVGGSCILHSHVLQQQACRVSRLKHVSSRYVNIHLTPCALMCCSTVPSRDSKMFLSPDHKKMNFSVKLHRNASTTLDWLFILAFSSSVRCSVLVLMTTFTLLTLKTWGNIPEHLLSGTHIPQSSPVQHWWELHRKRATSANLCFKSIYDFRLFGSPAPDPRLVPENSKSTLTLSVYINS